MERILITGEEARKKVREGVKKGAEPVEDSFGPFGNNSLIEKGTRITNDGAKILKEITLEDEVENLGLSKLKEAVAKSNEQVGDGSTTITILTNAILKEGKREVGGAKSTADFLKKIEEERLFVNEEIDKVARPIETEEELIASATVSVDDEELGKIIGGAQWKLGRDGYLLAEEVNEPTTTVEFISGVRYDNGVAAAQLFNNADNTALELENVRVILTNATLHNLEPMKDVLQSLLETKQQNIVIVARGWSEDGIAACARNFANGFKLYPFNAPYTDSREIMKDLEAVVGGRFIDIELASLEDMQLSDVGFAEKVKARRFDTLISGKGEKSKERIEKLQGQLESANDFERKQLKSRIAQLSDGFGLVKVGASSETERKRIFDKVEDAVNAVRAAFQEGTVPGGGLAFKQIADKMPEGSILKNPLQSLNIKLMANAPEGFSIPEWVRDPALVLKVALEQACSVGGSLATISSVVVTKKQKYNAYVEGNQG